MSAPAQTSDLHHALNRFSGSEISVLSEVRARFGAAPSFLDSVIALIADDDLLIQRAGGWLILESARDNSIDPRAAMSAAVPHLATVRDWQCALTLLQLADLLSEPIKKHEDWARFADAQVAHKRPFVRAWAATALCRLAAYHPEHLKAAVAALKSAREDPAASVRARARQIKLTT